MRERLASQSFMDPDYIQRHADQIEESGVSTFKWARTSPNGQVSSSQFSKKANSLLTKSGVFVMNVKINTDHV